MGLNPGALYRFDGSGNEIKLLNSLQLPVFQLMFPILNQEVNHMPGGRSMLLYSHHPTDIPSLFLVLHLFLYLFHWRAVTRAAAEWRYFCSCCGKENVSRVPRIGEAATAPSSHPVVVPSVSK